MEKLLRMNDAWGTHRGIMWLRSFDIFAAANPWQKLFGTGPDTFFFAFEPYFGQLQEYGNSSTDAAHNEYINYLITIGIAGLGSYLAFVGGALVRGFRSAKNNPAVLCCARSISRCRSQLRCSSFSFRSARRSRETRQQKICNKLKQGQPKKLSLFFMRIIFFRFWADMVQPLPLAATWARRLSADLTSRGTAAKYCTAPVQTRRQP